MTEKDEISSVIDDIEQILSQARQLPAADKGAFEDWGRICSVAREQVRKKVLRVAVVGAIKSGKSTFTNSLFKGDYLKRGAGVITSIVTRIRSGEHLKAALFFKTWDEINDDIRRALVFLPGWERSGDGSDFDIRRSRDRNRLHTVLEDLPADIRMASGNRNTGIVLLSSYLKGFDRVQEHVSSENRTVTYSADAFSAHTDFVGDDSLSVYLKDIELAINTGTLGPDIEIADCQGSDSANPLHLLMIQDYLLLTHLIVYVVSSRTGLREADVKFLSIIRDMGIVDNILFVVNCDFAEHENLENLQALLASVAEDIELIVAEPRMFAFSALFNLFRETPESLNQKDAFRLEQWRKESEFVEFSRAETERFDSEFHRMLDRERNTLLLKNHWERLGTVCGGVARWVEINRDILSSDQAHAERVIEKIRGQRERIHQTRTLLKTTLDGAAVDITREFKVEVDRFFSERDGVVKNTIDFIRNYSISEENYRRILDGAGFVHALYLVFQDFRKALEAFLTESVNPSIIGFVRHREAKILSSLANVVAPYEGMILDTLAGHQMEPFEGNTPRTNRYESPDLESIKAVGRLSFPPVVAEIRYSAKIKTDASFRLGAYTLIHLVRKAFKKNEATEGEEKILALKDGVRRMKRETEKAIYFHFKSYRENLKFQYITPLVLAASAATIDAFHSRFDTYEADFTSLAELFGRREEEKEHVRGLLAEMAEDVSKIQERMDRSA